MTYWDTVLMYLMGFKLSQKCQMCRIYIRNETK